VLSKRLKSCDRKFLTTKKRQKLSTNPSQHVLRAWKHRHFLNSISDVPQSMTRNLFKQENYTCNLFEKK
jgi:hypothetical protein